MITSTHHPLLLVYAAGWGGFCLVALGIVVRDWQQVRPTLPHYWAYLIQPWKLAVFVPALLFVTFAGRFTDDETWDVVTGGEMALLTFLTAPGCLGLFYQVGAGRRPPRHLLVASALLLFSSSWIYDGYLLWRDGGYTTRWWSNLLLSPILYVAAGLLWNLETAGGFRVRLGFTRADWPQRAPNSHSWPILLAALPLVLIAAFVLIAFVRWRWR